jgi:hypothetical protein
LKELIHKILLDPQFLALDCYKSGSNHTDKVIEHIFELIVKICETRPSAPIAQYEEYKVAETA